MGRSKFPGRPSKSINRKRISVLQLSEAAAAEQKEDGLAAVTTTTTNLNNKGGKCDDDDNEKDGSSGGSGGGGGGVAGGGSSSSVSGGGNNAGGGSGGTQNTRNVNGSNNTSNNGSGGSGGRNAASDSSTKAANIGTSNTSAAETTPETADNDAKFANEDATTVDAANIDEEQEEEDDDNASCTSKKSLQSTTSSTSSSSTTTTTITSSSLCSGSSNRKSSRKFKNLNLAKAEVMLPSSSKLKQKQQQLNCPSPTSSACSTSTSNNPFAATTETKVAANDIAAVVASAPSCNDNVDALNNCSDATLLNKKSTEMPAGTSSAGSESDAAMAATTESSDPPANDSLTNIEIDENKTISSTSLTIPPTAAASETETTTTTTANGTAEDTVASPATSKQKKTVTFRNILETSDDKSAVKKFYNPDNRIPLVSIMKKECMNRSMMYSRHSECIVRPSRLTEILKNHSNIDKLNSLKFRSATSSTAATSAIFGVGLSRAFGAPAEDDDHKHGMVTFRRNDYDVEDNNDEDDHRRHQAAMADDDHDVDYGGECNEDDDDGTVDNENTQEDKDQYDHDDNDGQQEEEDDDDDEQQMIVDKHFVLPKRSTRSSRVIKPNKRLLQDGIICKKSSLNAIKQKSSASSATVQQSVQQKKEQQHNYFGLGDITEEDDNAATLNLGIKLAKEANTNASPTTSSENKRSFSLPSAFPQFGGSIKTANNFILRQPRLQFDSLSTTTSTCSIPKLICSNTISPLGGNNSIAKFSTTTSSMSNATALNSSSLSPVSLASSLATAALSATTCSVCNTTIHYKNMPQARKFGVALACGACRKFISKIRKISSLKILHLECKSDGNCSIQPQAKGHVKNFKKAHKERCSSCWLKKCIQILQFPPEEKMRWSATVGLVQQVEAKREKDMMATSFVDSCNIAEIALRKDTNTNDLLSSTTVATTAGAGLFATTSSRFKWKSPLEMAAENLKLKLKSNPLAENNITFGSSPILRPAILEKSLFLKSIIDQQQQHQHKLQEKQINSLTSQIGAEISSSGSFELPQDKQHSAPLLSPSDNQQKSSMKTKRKEKQEKDKEKTKDKDKEREKEKEALTKLIMSNKSIETKSTPADAVELARASKSQTSTAAATASTTLLAMVTATSTATATASPTTTTTATATTTQTVTMSSPSTVVNAATLAAATTTTNSADASHKRQRIDLKGPRVKHVCRSASIVLGQPIATFGEDDDAETTATAATTANDNYNEDGDVLMAATLQAQVTTITAIPSENNEKISETNIVIDENDNCSSCKEQQPEFHQQQQHQEKSTVENTPGIRPTVEAPATKVTKLENDRNECAAKEVTKAKPLPLQPLQPSKTTTRNSNANNINLQVQQRSSNSSSSLSSSSNSSNSNSNSNSNYSTVCASASISKKYMRQFNYNDTILQQQQQQQRRKEASKVKALISIDFWENYDPAEVCQTGFGLIVTETVAQRALCFLCGSTGLDPLIFCACCCEPYHQYCVMDEYNLKHSSMDDTMFSLLDASVSAVATLATSATASNSSEHFNQIMNRLNWLCPRCTVCYTCNMSSGSKVKCQKCQKNYHSTCLGTSKRLLGADRPLICVNCLKCKSCSTTKVSKFVGNLPMCTSCFKLRKKGNYCPICQKCYDDNDFDLKMMECGDCKQWVHSKCEGLSDEQYNLLSTLPESIEFICKKCARHNESSNQRAQEWRAAVMEEFKTSLMTVLKLLSKSRQACALLKLSPRKKVRCTCSDSGGNGNNKIQPKSLQFNVDGGDNLSSEGESQCSDDIYEFKEKSVDEMPTINSNKSLSNEKCTCMKAAATSYYNNSQGQQKSLLSLVDIKKKISCNDYVSLAEFNYDMNNVIQGANCDELVIAYKEILSEQFPWFQNETKACTDALEEDMFESCSYALNNSLDSQEDFVAAAAAAAAAEGEQQRSDAVDLPVDIDEVIYSLKTRQDVRLCLFCRKTGEGMSNEESRLLYCGHDCWVHTNCAMWSAEVFEEIDGSLQNVHSAVARGRMIKCTVCGNRGATVGCNVKACGEHYHYPCARGIQCAFLTDKTMYCPEHAKSAFKQHSSPVTIETDFEVARPVYVELDRKRKKLLEPAKVQFHIGSLEVKQLGTIFPRFSDSFEGLIPIKFLCSRLYWSLKEPWKIVEYTVRTTIQNSYSTLTTLDAGRNFTVDHTNPNTSLVQLGLTQISRWHNSLARGELMETFESADLATMRNSTLNKLLPEYLAQNQNSSSATDDNTEEEPQTNADLLPPEIKDAIFEDLPHELLDGISMLDIFPKFMIYEEMGNSDGKTEMFLNDQSKDGVIGSSNNNNNNNSSSTNNTTNMQISDEDTVNSSSFSKQLDLSNSWSSSNLTTVNHVEDALLCSSARVNLHQVKRAISNNATTGELQQQRKSGEQLKKVAAVPQTRAWAKLDCNSIATAAAAAAIKRRKLSKGFQDMRVTEGMLLSLNQQRAVKKDAVAAVVAASRRQSQSNDMDGMSATTTATSNTLRTKTFTWSAAKRYTESVGKEDDSKIKLMQVDGVDDSITEYRIISADGTQFNGTVKCDRCHCTYRTYESFQRHLPNCEPLSSTSESESETTPRSPETSAQNVTSQLVDAVNEFNKLGQAQARTANIAGNALPFIQAFPQAIPIGSIQANISGIPIANMQSLQGLQSMQSLQNLQGLQNIQLQNLQPQSLGGNIFISQANPTHSAADEVQFYSNSLQGLTANLNGTYTLSPATTATAYGAAAQQHQQQHPQLIAVQSNADGTQQLIQLPAATTTAQQNQQQLLQGINAFQAMQATNSNKVMTGEKPMKTPVGSKVGQQSVAKKLKTTGSSVKPIQSKVTTAQQQPTTVQQQQQLPITVLNAAGGAGAQLLNQNLLQQMQAAAAATHQPQLLFQTTNAGAGQQQQPIIMQQLGGAPQNIISFVTTDGSQNPQVQYVSIPTGGTDYKTQAQASPFMTTATNANPLMQGAFLQTDASGNLVLTTTQTPTGLQMLAATPLNIAQATQPQAQVIGTLIQPQTLQLGGNLITATDPQQQQQQVIIGGGGTGLDMTPQVILATQPMYYGLETIVQNTVMSSQQFVSTAMPGVLSQNASFSATTTQVFQASKIEPIVDIPAGYVVLNNVDAGSTMVQQQQQQQSAATLQQQQNANYLNAANVLQQHQQSSEMQNNQQQQNIIVAEQQQQQQPTTYRIQTSTDNATTANNYQYQQPQQHQFVEPAVHQQQQQQATIVTAKIPPVAQVKLNNNSNATKATPIAAVTKVQPQQVVNKVMPTTQQKLNSNHQKHQHQQQQAFQNIAGLQQQQKVTIYNGNSNTNTFSLKPELNQQQHPQQLLSNTPAATVATKPLVATSGRKTNLIRPIHKAEVKPKVMKAPNSIAAKTLVTAQQQQKMALLKPQQQMNAPQQQQQQPQQHQQYQTHLVTVAASAQNNGSKIMEYETSTVNEQFEQQNAHQQQQPQFANVGAINATNVVQQQQELQQQQQQHLNNSTIVMAATNSYDYNQQQQIDYDIAIESTIAAATNESYQQQQQQQDIGNILPPTTNSNRLQYSNFNSNVPTNIVNPLQQTTLYPSTTSAVAQQQQQHNSTRPTNRVLPMQQRQDNVNSTAAGGGGTGAGAGGAASIGAQSPTTTKLAGSNKCYDIEQATTKISYEAVVKKDQEMLQEQLMLQLHNHEQQQQHLQQQHDSAAFEKTLNIAEHQQQQEYIVNKCDLQVMENEASCQQQQQQLQMVSNEFVTAANNCLINSKVELMTTPEHQPFPSSDNNVADMDATNDVDGEDDDDDDDGFSLKMPTEDDDHEMSDSDEPAVKEKISKILDNLTNEDCADSLATATTIEATNIEHNNHQHQLEHTRFMSDEDLANVCMSAAVDAAAAANERTKFIVNTNGGGMGNDNSMSAEETAVAAAAVAAVASEYISQMAESMNAAELQQNNDTVTTSPSPQAAQSIIVDDSNFELKKIPHQQLDDVSRATDNTTLTAAAACNVDELMSCSMRRPTPQPPHPMRDPKKINGPHLLYEIQSEDGFTYKSTSITDVWEKVFEAVQVARRAHGLAPLPEGPLADMSGIQMIGLKTNALKYLIEQLPGVERCTKYTPKYHKRSAPPRMTTAMGAANSSSAVGAIVIGSGGGGMTGACAMSDASGVISLDYASDQELDLQENPYECVRCEPYSKRSEYDMFSWLASRHRKQPIQVFVQPSDNELIPRRGTGSNLPMAMKYRTLKETYKDYVGVFRSHIHGRGLYCTKDIEAGEMVIEYAGELIRSTLTDKRERNYDSRGIGCYMFKIDDNLVVDATMRGNAARFINHSCEPNCYSKVVDILGHKHIIIFALRRIVQGEELTYDYKFPFEDEKIPCSCGSKKCRKYLN